jgi:predicted nucleic acid-binding Zn finger protein
METAQELHKRNNKAQHLRVIQVEDGDYFVSSEEGKILYKVTWGDGKENFCTCGDFAKGLKNDPQFKCKHILAVMNSETDTEKARYLEKAQPKLDPRFIVQIDNQDFVKYAGLLDLAHQKKLTNLEAEIVQYPTKDNERTAICKAHAKTAFGESFIDFGDANPTNCNAKVARHLIRMASTRAKARCLRDLTNVGITCLEELGDLDEVIGNEKKGITREGKVKPFPKKIVKPATSTSGPNNGNGKGTVSAAENKETKGQAKELQKDEKKTTADSKPEAKVSEKSGNDGRGKTKAETPPPKISEAQHRALMNLSRRRGISVEELEKLSQETYGVSVLSLSGAAASQFIRTLQQSA